MMAEQGLDDSLDYPGRMLHQASIYNNTDFMASLLQGAEREHIDAQDPYGRTALYTSVTNNSLECGHMLLQAGADANIACGAQCGCMTPLHAAALDNKQQFVSILLQYGAKVNVMDASGERAIDLAHKNRSEESLAILKSDIEAKDKQRDTLFTDFAQACLLGMLDRAKELSEQMSEKEILHIVNNIPDDGNSLLYRSCERGDLEMVDFLLTQGADVQVHPVTGQSPLHGACLRGQTHCVKFMLQYFPELIRAPTIDGTFPLHVACAEGHLEIVELLLQFPYPDLVKKLFKESKGDRMYRLGLALNAKDGHGRTPIQIAVTGNNPVIVKRLLSFKVAVALKYRDGVVEEIKPGISSLEVPIDQEECEERSENGVEVEEATERVFVHQNLPEFCPVEVDLADLDGNMPLHIAVRGDGKVGFHHIATLLLQHKADPNAVLERPGEQRTPLMEACSIGDVKMMELLLRYGAKDDDQKILNAVVKSNKSGLIGAMIQYKSHGDSEFKVNYLAVMERTMGKQDMMSSTSLKALWPNTPVTINWHGLGLRALSMDWFVKSCHLHIGRPPGPAKGDGFIDLSLFAITRIDISNNKLQNIPQEIFQLPSLRILNASHNRIKALHRVKGMTSGQSQQTLSSVVGHVSTRGQHTICSVVGPGADNETSTAQMTTHDQSEDIEWNCPLLEEIYLAKNKMKTIPAQIFSLPVLRKLAVAHNEISSLPYEMWTSPSLTELNLSHNQLQSLPNCYNAMEGGLASQLDSFSICSGTDSSSGSKPATPKHQTLLGVGSPGLEKESVAVQNVSAINTDLTDIVEGSESMILSVRGFKEVPVHFETHWRERTRIRVATPHSDSPNRAEKVSKMIELNISHNQFEHVPLGLACLAPQLSKLTLSHNLLKQVGPMENYPANLRFLDLSHNKITNDVLFECSYGGTDGEGTSSWAIKTCYSPTYQARHRSHSRDRTSSRSSARPGRSGSTSSLQSLSSTTSSHHVCPHRMHHQLEKLKTLWLTHNKLVRLVLTVGREVEDELEASLEEPTQGPPKKGRPRLSSASNADLSDSQKLELFFPNLSVLYVCHNNLVTLPDDICELTQLAELKISFNRLKELPPAMGLLKKLWNLDYRGCPVENSLCDLLGDKAKKTSAVLGYLKSIKEEATPYNRMKLMFVGIQGIGKTSLLSQLKKEGRSSPQRNWAQRMGQSTIQDKDLKGENISTVGVDIGDLVIQRTGREVIFSTWDFGGQREYYATHQYFLSKRSLYLVVWKVTDGEKGVNEIHQWLVNIQARAPNSPVIIVGTHLDLVTKKRYPANFVPELQRMIFDKYQAHTEPDKCGLPRVLGRIEVSCKPRIMYNTHVSDLVNMIWQITCEEQLPGNRGTRLVEQKVPASYVHLQDVVCKLAEERKRDGKDPVLHSEQYKPLVIHKMEEMYNTSFRDVAELNQATQFLHENGVLLHYDDVNLQDIYFLDPQWLCDMLANVVTIREINSLARSGIMRSEDLKVLFKNAAFKPEDIRTYIINLLNKFEVALLWDNKNLLIPSLLPTEMESRRGLPGADVRVPVKGASRMSTTNNRVIHTNIVQTDLTSQQTDQSNVRENRHSFHIESTGLEGSMEVSQDNTDYGLSTESVPTITRNPNPVVSIVRLYMMSYFPSGFWPRLITRLLADDSFYCMVLDLYDLLDVLRENQTFMSGPGNHPEWKCWQTGVELVYLGVPVLRIKEVSQDVPNDFCDYRQCELVIKQENDVMWNPLNLTGTSILEIFIPNESLTVSVDTDTESQNVIMQPVSQIAASFLAKIVEHIDTLLEDWYPDLGARFVQNAKGMYLITRIVPCSRCILQQIKQQRRSLRSNMSEAWSMVDVSPVDHSAEITQPILINPASGIPATSSPRLGGSADICDQPRVVSTQLVAESAPAGGVLRAAMAGKARDTDRGAAQEQGSVGGKSGQNLVNQPSSSACGECEEPKSEKIVCYLVEQCLQAAQSNRVVFCPDHGNLGPYFLASVDGHVQHAHVAPDSVLQDVGEEYLVYQDLLSRGKFLGKGAFGAVYAGTMVDKKSGGKVNVAMKMLQPVKPEQGASPSQVHQYENEKTRWDKDPMKNACEAYLNARKELTILLSLRHDNIVPLLGISLQPLCLILSLAPLGSLGDQLAEYSRAGARLPVYAITRIIMQVAAALDYLHCHQIIYRDLKSENVLVWSMPPPHHIYPQTVEVKLADYGVSRTVLPSGTKGLAGTPPFIAPEIIQHNGEESYTEKVDCFSFGMFLYEMLLLRLPFDGEATAAAGGANLKGHILAGGRPSITNKEVSYPTHILDLMTLCWSHDPNDRPSAAEILAIAQTPEFSHLYNVIHGESGVEVVCGCSSHWIIDMAFSLDDVVDNPINSQSDVWLATYSTTDTSTIEGALLIYSFHQQDCFQARTVPLGPVQICCMCVTEDHVWCADRTSTIHVFSRGEYEKVMKFPATSRTNIHVKCMAYGSAEKQVYVVMDNGSFVVCDSHFLMESSKSCSPVKTECPGNGRPIHCIGVLPTSTKASELWCGQAGGRISIWNMHNTSLRRVQHFDSEKPSVDTVSVTLAPDDSSSVWSYVYPGTIVYRWNTKSQKIVGELDVSKYGVSKGSAPQSPQIIKGRSQVTSMNVLRNELYIGTTAGCLIVADKNHMTPIAICNCHGSSDPYISAILSLNVDDSCNSGSDDDSDDIGGKGDDASSPPIILTIGKGYRDMIGLVLPNHKRKTNVENKSMMLTWAAEHWTKPL